MSSSFEEILKQQGKLVYTNVGTSMLPLLRERRDLLIIGPKPEGRLKMWDVPLFRRDDGKYVMHRVLWVRHQDYLMCGDNQWRVERGITDRHIIGVLEAVKRNGHVLPVRPTAEHPVVPFRYRLYVALWCLSFPLRCPYLMVTQTIARCLYYHRHGMLGKKVRKKLFHSS